MLKYLIAVTGSTAVLAVLLGLMYAWVTDALGVPGRRALTVSVLLGAVGAAVYQALRTTTKIIDKTGGNPIWNVRIFAVALVALVLFDIFCLPLLRRFRAGRVVAIAAACLLTFTQVFYALPPVFGYPTNFNLNGDTMLSSAFVTRFIGYLLGIVLALVTVVALYRAARRLPRGLVCGLLCAALLVNAVLQVTTGLGTLYTRRYISGHELFVFIRTVTNNSRLFIFAVLLIALVVPVWLWVKSFNVKEPYTNPGEHRKIRAKWRSNRRWSTTVICCFLLAVVTLTWFSAIDNRVIELSPVEECQLDDTQCLVPLTQVDDGHLHRFAYTSENGVDIRFIIIKKPNSSAYGVGLDSCDICGETGYFERNGQIVCKLCDVVMNVNTIGFKGGCNPKVIDYSVGEGFIKVPFSTLLEHEKDFKK